MEKTRRRNWRKSILGLSAIVFAASFAISLVPSIRAIAEGAIFKIKSAEITQLSSGVDGTISSHDDSTIVSNVTFHKLGDTATYKVVLQNTDSKDHVIETISDDNANSHISYSYNKHANETIAAGANLDFVFEAKYVKTPNTNERQQVSKVKFSIHFTDIDEPEEVIVAPSTYDGLGASFVVLAISSLGLIVCAAIYIKNHKKAAKVLTVALVAALATAVIASVKAATVEVNSFTLTTNYGLYDKVVITYTDKNGDEQELISNYNEPANIPDQSKDGYTLTGWEDEQGNPVDPTQPITEDVKIHPIYRTHTYTIKFNSNGANGEMTNLAMTYDETKTLPANAFDFPGRTYAGWDTEANGSGIHYDDQAEVKNLTSEDNGVVTLYAQWSINPFHIDYDGNGATSGEMATTNCEYDSECVLRENAFVKTGYHFVGWKYSNNDYADKADVKNIIEGGTITMVAQWEVNHYTIVFDINTDDSNASGDMADMANLEYDHDYILTANAFTRTGYNFGGWNTEIDGRNFGLTDEQEFHNLTTTDNAVITLYAQWDPTQYTIIFHANNENVENPDAMAVQVVTYDVETTLNPIEYTWWQHKLVEWTTNANGTGTKYADKAAIKNLNANGGEVHLYAKWREIDAALQAGGVGRSPTGTRINALLAANPDAKRFVKYTAGIPSDEVLANAVDTSGTIDPIWLWVEGENLYWWSEDVKPRISSRLTSTDCLFNGAGTYTVDGVTKHLEYADLTGFDTSNITDYGRTFHSSGILEINISDWDFSHATNMSEFIAFGAVKKATFPEVVDARNVTNMYLALNFGMVTDELDLSGWKTRDVKNLNNFLSGMQAKKIKFSSDFKTNNVENMASMFSGNSRLTSIEGLEYFDTAKVKNMSNMFASVSSMESLDLSTFSTAALTNMNGMFSGMSSLTSLTLGGSFTANDVTAFTNTFKGLTKLQTIDLSNLTSTPTDMSNMFESSSGAKVIDISGMDLSAVTKFTYTFIACGNLETIYVSNNPNQENITDDGHIFLYSGPKIVGGAGSNHLGSAAGTGNGGGSGQSVYARIDDPDNGKPGYFTPKDSIYIRYHDNDGDDTNDEANYALMPSYYVSTAEPYDVKLRTNAFEKEHYKFIGWATSANGAVVYADGAALEGVATSKTPHDLYAVWKERTATLTQGWNNTAALKRINADATSFEHWTGETPDFEAIDGEENIALSNSNFPVYAWTADDKIYWWSEADTIYMNASSTRMFSGMEKLQSIDISQFDSSLLTGLEGMFENTSALTNINFGDNFQTGNVTNFRDMFSKAKSLTELDLHTWDVSSFNMDLRKVFNGCSSLTSLNLDGWDLSHTTGADDWLAGTNSLQTFSMKGGKLPSNSRYLFQDLKATTINLDNLDTSKATNMSMMFARATGAIELDLHTWDVSNVQNMYQMFVGSKFTGINIDGWQTSSLTNMVSMFNGCTNLVSIDLSNIDTSKVEDMQGAFMNVPIATLDISAWNTSKNTSVRTMFSGMTNAETIYVGDGWSTELITGANDSATLPLSGMTNKLVGGAGTVWSDDKKNGLTYLHLDDPCDNNPGLFSKKNARYVCYDSNIPDGETNAGAKTGDYLPVGTGNLMANGFIREGYIFTGWKDANGNEYTDEQVMAGLVESKTPLKLYAQWIEATSVLKTGPDVNIILKSINPDAVAFTRYNGIPDFDAIDNEQVISLSNAVVPTYAWSNNDTIYWWSEAETVYLNENSGSFFKNLSKLTTIEQATLDTSKVKNMDHMFQYSGLVDFTFEMNTSNVTSMDAIFANCSKLERLDLSHVDTSKVTNMHGLVADAQKLTYLNLDNFSTASATNLESMFSTVKLMTTLDLTSFDTRKVTNMGWMISYITNLQTIYATDLFVPANNISMPNTLVGGAGSRNLGTSSVYARIDDPDNGNPGYFTIKGARYIRYHDNDGNTTNDEASYSLMTSHYLKAGEHLKKNAFVRDGYVFTGWKDVDNNEYTDEQVMADLTESKTPLELYAQWDAAPYAVTFNANGGEVLQSAKTVTYLQSYGELPTPVRYDYVTSSNGSMLGGKYGFKEWNTKADGKGDTITSSSIYANTDDTTLYAIWNDRFIVTIYNGESETPTIASYGIDDEVELNAQNVAGKQFLYWEVDGAKKSYSEHFWMRMYQGKDLIIRAIYGSESDLESQQPGTYISDIYRQYSGNKIVARSYSYVPDGYEIVKAGVVATLDANIANGTFDDQTATYPRAESVNGSNDNYYFTWSKSKLTSEDTVYVKAYLVYKDADGVEHTIYGDLVTATLTE